jgi:hypothetical protein
MTPIEARRGTCALGPFCHGSAHGRFGRTVDNSLSTIGRLFEGTDGSLSGRR